jgi:prolyl oligopeptidase
VKRSLRLCNFREWLIENKYVARGKIAINGGSNGGMLHRPQTVYRDPQVVTVSTGLLVSACVNRAPEGLIGAALAEVGVHDLLKVQSHVSICTH